MAEVRLRKDFPGALIAKVSSDSLGVTVEFDYKGPAQTLDIETNTGKKGIWGDYDQESPAYHDSKPVSASDTFIPYTFSRSIPLSFWGSREIDDCAVEVVIRGEGVYDDAVLWDAYTVNLVAVGISFQVGVAGTPVGWAGYDRWMCYYYDPGISDFVGDNQWHGVDEYLTFAGVQTGGYFAAFVLRTSDPSACSPQYTSGPFWSEEGRKYIFNIAELKVYVVA